MTAVPTPVEDAPAGAVAALATSGARLSPALAAAFAIATLSALLAIYHVYHAVFGENESLVHNMGHLTLVLTLCFLLYPLDRRPWRSRSALAWAVDLPLVALSLGSGLYILYDPFAFNMRAGYPETRDIVAGSVLIGLVFEASRRTVGLVLVAVAGTFVLHALTASHWPGFFFSRSQSWTGLVEQIYLSGNGVFGIPLTVMASTIVIYLLFGALLVESGAGRFFLDFAMALTGRARAGPAKCAVVASALFGTVSGSAVSNVVTTGTFTIPLMKRVGYAPAYAGGIEAVASSGGQITPPILGVTAFIIADFLGVGYLTIAAAATIPAALYYFSLYLVVDLAARRQDIGRGGIRAEPLLAVLRRDGHLAVAPFVIIALLVNGFSAVAAGIYGCLSLLALCALRPHTRFTPLRLLQALERGARTIAPISLACACSGIIIGAIFASALGVQFTNALVGIAGDYLLVALLVVMLAAFILGMGLTTSADYIILAVLAVPTLTALGATPLSAHMFVFYFASVSGITPPVALAAFAAASIAGAGMQRTGWIATRLGFAAYLIPFLFVYHPALLLQGGALEIAAAAVGALLSLACFAGAVEGWLLGPAAPWQRLGLAVAATLMLSLTPAYFAAGLALAATMALTTWRARRAMA